MTDQAVGETRRLTRMLDGPLAALRFLFSDRLGIVLLLWIALAFVMRPLLMQAHGGTAGPVAEWLRVQFEPLVLARTAGTIQWASLAGLVLALALTHARLAFLAPDAMRRNRFALGAAYALALTLGYIFFIWTPSTTVSLMLHDSFIFFDAIHRIDAGQVPSVDFPTPLGAAMLYLPWLGSKISGGYAGAIEISSAIVALGLCLACAYACANRHSGAVMAVLIAAIFLIAVPMMLEGYAAPDSVTQEGGKFVSIEDEYAQAMFYNRWGWGALIAIFAFLTPRGDKTPIAEIATLGALLVFLFWLKFSYFLVGGAAAVLYGFLGPKPWRTIGIGAGVALGGIASVGLITGNLFAYVGDIVTAAKVSGARANDLAELIKENFEAVLIALSPIVVMGLMGKLKAIDVWITGVILLGTLFIINQNAQTSGLPTMLAVSAYAVWRLKGEDNRALRLIAAIGLALPAAGFFLDRGSGLLGHTVVSRREEARPAPAWAGIPALKNVYAQERENELEQVVAADTPDARKHAFRSMAMYGRRQVLRSAEYVGTLMAAMDDLKGAVAPGESVVVMDFSTPLGFLMDARPAKGYWLTFDDGRTISEDVAPEGDVLFADADHVMMPKIYMEPDTAIRMRQLYKDYLDGAYAERIESEYWVRWSHRKDRQDGSTQLAGQGL